MKKIFLFSILLFSFAGVAHAQPRAAQPTKTLTTEEYDPKSSLVTKETKVDRAKFPFVDVHSHHGNLAPEYVDKLVREMDSMNMKVMVNLSGGTGERLQKLIAAMKTRHPDRFIVFANMTFDDINEPGYGERQAKRLEQDVKNGAQGLKVFKNFGMDMKYKNGERVKVDDPNWDPVWAMCAKLKIPILIHIAEPNVFFDPIDNHNERWLELNQFPQTSASTGKISNVRDADDRTQSHDRKKSEDEFHPRASWVITEMIWRDLANYLIPIQMYM